MHLASQAVSFLGTTPGYPHLYLQNEARYLDESLFFSCHIKNSKPTEMRWSNLVILVISRLGVRARTHVCGRTCMCVSAPVC